MVLQQIKKKKKKKKIRQYSNIIFRAQSQIKKGAQSFYKKNANYLDIIQEFFSLMSRVDFSTPVFICQNLFH